MMTLAELLAQLNDLPKETEASIEEHPYGAASTTVEWEIHLFIPRQISDLSGENDG